MHHQSNHHRQINFLSILFKCTFVVGYNKAIEKSNKIVVVRRVDSKAESKSKPSKPL